MLIFSHCYGVENDLRTDETSYIIMQIRRIFHSLADLFYFDIEKDVFMVIDHGFN